MKTILILTVGFALTGCASLGGDPTSQLPSEILANLQHCQRTYTASIGGLGIPGGSLHINCDPIPRAPEN